MGYLEDKLQRNRALLRALGHIEDEAPPAEPQGPPNFDGGAREPAPLPSNPETDHNQFIVQLLEEHRGGGAGDFWPMAPKSPPAQESSPDQDEGDWRKGGT